MSLAEALQNHRLIQLLAILAGSPRQGLAQAVQSCRPGQSSGLLRLSVHNFGIVIHPFLLSCRRAAEDRRFRRLHSEAQPLLLLS